MNNTINSILIIAIASAVTILIRVLPFIIFDRGGKLPSWVEYLGKVLPPALMSLLLVYCVSGVDFASGTHGIPEAIGIVIAMILHFKWRNTLVSIGVSTAVYMLLVNLKIF